MCRAKYAVSSLTWLGGATKEEGGTATPPSAASAPPCGEGEARSCPMAWYPSGAPAVVPVPAWARLKPTSFRRRITVLRRGWVRHSAAGKQAQRDALLIAD